MRELVSDREAVDALRGSHHGGDAAVERELDEDTCRRRHRLGDRIEEITRSPMQQRAEHQKQQVISIEVRNRDDGILQRELAH